jgi:hypothetical protein
MKTFIKWLVIVGILVLIICCIDINFNRTKFFSMSSGQIKILNIATIVTVLIAIFWMRLFMKMNKKRE